MASRKFRGEVKIKAAQNLGCRISRLDPIRLVGRQINRVIAGNVVAQGTVGVYGNDIRIFQVGTNVLITVLVDILPRWWLVATEPSLQVTVTFTSPGYIAPFDGSIRSGATLPTIGGQGGGTIDIAGSHPFSVWAEINRPSIASPPVLANFLPMAPTSRLSLPSANPAGVLGAPFATITKTSATAAVTNFSGTNVTPLPNAGGILTGLLIEGSFAGSELGGGSTATNIIDREQLFLFVYLQYDPIPIAAGDIFYIGDISQYAPWKEPYSFKIVIGANIGGPQVTKPKYDPASSILGLWAPHTEQGEGGAGVIFSTVKLNIYQIGFPNTDVAIPFGTGSGPLAGQSIAGLQGETMQPTTG